MLRSSLNTKPLGVVLLTCSRHVFFFLRKVCKNSSPKLLTMQNYILRCRSSKNRRVDVRNDLYLILIIKFTILFYSIKYISSLNIFQYCKLNTISN